MAPIGTPTHIESCVVRALNEAVALCGTNMELGLTVCERIVADDPHVINEILRRGEPC